MILLQDLLRFSEKDIKRAKIKFNTKSGDIEPLDVFLDNPERVNTNWLLHRGTKWNYKVGELAINCIDLGDDLWLLTIIKEIRSRLDVKSGVGYEAEELELYKNFYGRVVIKYHKNSQNNCRFYKEISDKLEVLKILPDVYTEEEFPGYENVCLSYEALERIIKKNISSWIAALSSQKAVYLITDISTGRLYVGSATAKTGQLLSRWKSYIENGHGGNVALKALIEKDSDYAKKYYQFSILENYNARVSDEYVLKRENWWKKVLQTREFGYNKN